MTKTIQDIDSLLQATVNLFPDDGAHPWDLSVWDQATAADYWEDLRPAFLTLWEISNNLGQAYAEYANAWLRSKRSRDKRGANNPTPSLVKKHQTLAALWTIHRHNLANAAASQFLPQLPRLGNMPNP